MQEYCTDKNLDNLILNVLFWIFHLLALFISFLLNFRQKIWTLAEVILQPERLIRLKQHL